MQANSNGIIAGAGLILLAVLVIGLNDNFVRFISPHAGLWQFHAVRSAGALVLLLAFAWFSGASLRIEGKWRMFLRTLAMTISIFLYFGAIPVLPIAHVGAGLFTAPIWVLIWSMLLFRQRIGLWRAAAILTGFAGVMLILKPEGDSFSLWNLMPLTAGAFYGLANLLTREWCARESTLSVTVAFFAAMGLAGLALSALLSLVPPAPELFQRAPFLLQGWAAAPPAFWFWAGVQAVLALVGVSLLNRGYQLADAGAVSVFEYFYLISAGFWGWVLWGQTLDARSAAGIVLIVVAGVIIALRSRRDHAALLENRA
jgi:drug/metabolite transporter (DMT)-like permease